MARVLSATCVNGVVTSDGVQIPSGVQILSEGVASSSGYLIIDQDRLYYVSKTSPDLKDVITQLNSIVQQIQTIFTAIDAVTTTPGSSAALITALNALRVTFNNKKDALK